MRYSEIAPLPVTPSEAKNTILDIITVYQGRNLTEVPLNVVLKTLHRQNFDLDKRLLIDLIKEEPNVERITSDNIILKSREIEDVISPEQEDKSQLAVKQMAKKKIKKEIGE